MSVLPAHKIVTATTVSELETKLASATTEGYVAQSIAADAGILVAVMVLTPPDILWRRNNPTVLE